MNKLVPLDDDWDLWPVAPVRGAGLPFDWLAGFAGTAPEPDAGQDGPDDAATVRQLLRQPAFLAALTWQNPGLVRTWAGRADARLNAYRLGMIAKYAQRYCAKNDSIGFFGPVGWAELGDSAGSRLEVSGTGGVRHGEAALELWAVRALAHAWEQHEPWWPHLPLHRNPSMSLDGYQVLRPYRVPLPLDAAERDILDRVAAGRTIPRDVGTEDRALRWLLEHKVLGVGFSLPPSDHPEDSLRAQVADIADGSVRGALLSELDGLIRSLRDAEKFATRPAELAEALGELDRAFTAATGETAGRTKADAGAGRTLAYLDCRRDLDVRVPKGMLDRLAAPLLPLLRSARWLTAQVAQAVEEEMHRAYAELVRRRVPVVLSDLYLASAEVLAGTPGTPVHDIGEDFRLRWAEVLGDARDGTAASSEIEPLVRRLFPAQEPGWAAARHHSPDLMLADTEDDPLWVLGELHVAMNTLESRFFRTLADDPARLDALTAADMGGGRVVPCYPYSPQIDSRRYPPVAMHVPGRYRYWSHSDDMGTPDGSTAVPAAALEVRERSGELVAGPDGGDALPVREYFGEFLSALVVNQFRMPAPGPRVSVDGLVVRRATWTFRPDQLPAGVVGKRGYRPEVLRDWLLAQGLPRHVFAQGPADPKPLYVDLQAPLLVSNLARTWRRETQGLVRIQEMLPTPGQLWLRDVQGHRYTSEFRMVAVDRAARVLPGLAAEETVGRGMGEGTC